MPVRCGPDAARAPSFWRMALALLCLVAGAAAAEVPLDPASARFRRVDSSLGLSQDSVMSLAQTAEGYVWLGTQDGLNRFDGVRMQTYRADGQPGSIGGNWISSLATGADGTLWVGTSAGLFRYLPGDDRFELFSASDGRGFSGGFVYQIFRDRKGVLWVGSDAGLSRWSRPRQRFEHFPVPSTLGAERRIRAIADDSYDGLWLGTPAGLLRFDPASARFAAPPDELGLDGEPVNELLVDRHGLLWIASEQRGVIRFAPGTGAIVRYGPGADVELGSPRAYVVAETTDGTIWLGMEDGLYRVPAERLESPAVQAFHHRAHDPQSLGRGRVVSLLEDRDGSFWVGTWDSGASLLDPARRRVLSFHPESLATGEMAHPSVLSVAADNKQFWLGTMQGVYTFDSAGMQLAPLPGSEAMAVFAMQKQGATLWLGTDNSLRRHQIGSGRWQSPLAGSDLAEARVRRLLVEPDRVWLYAERRGLYVFDASLREQQALHALPGQVNHLFRLDADTMLVSAGDGLHWLSGDGRRVRHHTPVEPGREHGLIGRPSTITRDGFGRLWVALYGAGLAQLQLADDGDPAGAKFFDVTRSRGLANAGVNSVIADDDGRLWLATDRGISVFDPTTTRLRNFAADDGALTRGYYFGAAARLGSGQLVFGSKDGFSVLDPLLELPQRQVWPPLIYRIERDGQVQRPHLHDPDSWLPGAPWASAQFVLPAGWGRNLVMHFSSPEYVAPGQLDYRYRLEGIDPDWVTVSADRAWASYGNLPPGQFVLHLQAEDRDGRFSDERRVEFMVLPHWWQTTLVRVLAALALFFLLAGVYFLRVRHLEAQRHLLEQRVAERTQALNNARQRAESTLHSLKSAQEDLVRAEKLAALGQLVAGVAHEVNTPIGVAVTASSHFGDEVKHLRNQLAGGKLARRDLEKFLELAAESSALIGRNLQRAAELVRSFKQVSVDRSSDGRRRFALDEFLGELTQSLRLLWKHRPIVLDIDCPPSLVMDSFPGALGQVLTNLAQNALLHAFDETQPGTLRIEVRPRGDDAVTLCFEDNGRGIAAADLARVFEPFFTTRRGSGGTGLGLHIVHNLVTHKLGGTLRVDSTPGRGTRFELGLPLSAR